MILVPLVGVDHNGAKRWIELPVLGEFQPSELMKDAVIISFSYYAVRYGDRIRQIRGDLPFFGALALIAGLLYLEPHLSATIIIFGIGLAILIVSGCLLYTSVSYARQTRRAAICRSRPSSMSRHRTAIPSC